MSETAEPAFGHPRRYVRLDTILRLRWLTALGQLVAVFIVVQGMNFEAPVIPCLTVIGLSSFVNILLQMAFRPVHRLDAPFAALLLAMNIAELAALLLLTGGLQNPFSFLFVAPVLISATALPTRYTVALGLLAATCATVLGFFHLPLPWNGDEPLVLPPTYMVGVWLSIMLSLGVTSVYAFQVTEEARKLADALAATELVLTREQHLTQIDGLAAAAAHELGTPLSTIFLVARELENASTSNSALAGPVMADLKVIREQAKRCRDILAKITQLPSEGAPFDRMPLANLIEETVAPHREFGIAIKVHVAAAAETSEPVGLRNPAVLYGVGNILENAVDFAGTTVEVNAGWTGERVEIVVSDDGPGIAPDILKKIGEPYLSRRPPGEDGQSEHRGLGLGVFIARTLLERTGASVEFANRVFPDHGAVVTIVWPRERFATAEI